MNYYVFLILFSSIFIYQIIKLIRLPKESRAKQIAPLVAISIITGYFLLDIPYLISGGIQKESEVKIVFGFGRRGNYNAILQDENQVLYWVGSYETPLGDSAFFVPKEPSAFQLRLTYLPFTKSVAKIEHKVDIDTVLFVRDTRYTNPDADGYYEIYNYSYDLLNIMVVTFILGVSFAVVFYRKWNE